MPERKKLQVTSHWQNGGVTAKLKVSAYLSAECVPHSAFFNNLASVETHRLRSRQIELLVQFIRHFANAFPVMRQLKRRHQTRKIILTNQL